MKPITNNSQMVYRLFSIWDLLNYYLTLLIQKIFFAALQTFYSTERPAYTAY